MGKTTKTTTENKPPAWSEGLFVKSAEEAQRLYDSGSGGQTYEGNTVAPLSDTTMAGVNQLAQAGQSWDTSATRPLFAGLGAAAAMDPTAGYLTQIANGVQGNQVNSSIATPQVNTSGIQGYGTDLSRLFGQNVDTSGIQGRAVDTSGFTGGQTDISRLLGFASNAGGGGGQTDTSGIVARDVGAQAVDTSGIQAGNTDLSGLVGQQVSTQGYNAAQQAAAGISPMAQNLLNGISTGQEGITNETDWRGILERSQGQSAAEQYLTPYATGQYLENGNPYYRQRLDQEIQDANSRIQSTFSGAGRYGSGANADVVSKNTNQMLLQGLESDWNRQQANQLASVGMIDQARQAGLGSQLAAAAGISGVQGQNISNRLAGAGQMIGAQSDMTSQLRGVQDSISSVETANANRLLDAAGMRAQYDAGNQDRALQAATTRAGFDTANADRLLQADTGNADRSLQAAVQRSGFQSSDLDRAAQVGMAGQQNALNALIAASGFQAGDLERALQSQTARASFDAGNADRSLDAATTAAGFQAGNADRSLQAATTSAGFDAGNMDRLLQAAGMRAQFDEGNANRVQSSSIAQRGIEADNANRLLQAAGLQGDLINQAGAANGANIERGMAAAGAMSGLDQQNFQNMLTGAGATLDAGKIIDNQTQMLLADEIARFYALDNQEWQRLGMLQAAAAGASGNYGVQNQTTRQPVNIGGALSGLGSLFAGKSDVRLKEDIIAVGAVNGITVYEFSYLGQPDRWVGVMAQELPMGSDAVILEDDGFYAVDYAKLGFPMTRA